MRLNPLGLAVACIAAGVALYVAAMWGLARAAARAEKASVRAARCPGCKHQLVGAAFCGAPIGDVLPGMPALCGCVHAWHLNPGGEKWPYRPPTQGEVEDALRGVKPLAVATPSEEQMDRLWQQIVAAQQDEERGR